MNPDKGCHVKCLLRNNILIEGIVEYWSDTKSVLKSLDGESLSIIQRTSDDILLVKIILKKFEKSEQKLIENKPIVSRVEIAKKLKETLESPTDSDLQKKNIEELKKLSIQQEKEIVANRIKEHSASEIKKTKYSYPNFFKKKENNNGF